MASASFSEDHLVEQPAIQLMQHELGWEVVAIEGAVEEICRDFFLTALSLAEANWEIDKRHRPGSEVLFVLEPDRQCNRLGINEFLFELKTSIAVSPLGETQHLSEIPVRKLMKSLLSRNRENGKNVKIGLPFTKNRLFTTT